MEIVTSKKHPTRFYLTVVLILILGVSVGLFTTIHSFKYHLKPNAPLKYDLLIVLGIAIIIFSFYTVFQYFKNAPKVTIDWNSIRFNSEKYLLKDIKTLNYTGKQKFGLFLLPSEGMKITFCNGDTKYIFDHTYLNSHIIKQYIKYTIETNDKDFYPLNITPIKIAKKEHFSFYKGSFLFSFRTLVFIALISIPLFTSKISISIPETLKLPALITAFLILLFSGQFYYFELNNKYFKIRSFMKFWNSEIYDNDDILEVLFESNGKAANSLKLITKDFKSKYFFASTLNDKDWNELQKAFEALNIKVRNEI